MSKTPPEFPIGRHAGRALAHAIADVTVRTRLGVMQAEAEHRRRAVEGAMDDWEVTLGEFVAKWLSDLRQLPNLPTGLQYLLDTADSPQHQTDFIVELIAAIGGVLSIIGPLGQALYRPVINSANAKWAAIPLAPADAASATVRLGVSRPTALGWAQQSGIAAEAFGLMCDLSGEPPPLDEMRQMVFEGRLSEADFDQMFAFSRVRTDWLAQYKSAHQKTMSAADAIEGYIKGALDQAQASALFVAAGGRADQFDVSALIAGNPIGVEQAGQLYNHGLINDAQYTQVIFHSRINPEFEAMAKLTRFHYLSAYQIHTALAAGQVNPQDATRWLIQEGYPADQVAAIVKGATSAKAAKPKTVALSVVVDSYEAGLIDQAQAAAQLQALGYTAAEANVELQGYDARRILSIIGQGITAVRKGFLADRITAAQASGELDSLGVHPSLRDHYLALWAIEVRAEFKTLTMAQVGSMFKKGVVTEHFAISKWESMGYSAEDATLLLYEYGKPLPNNRPVA